MLRSSLIFLFLAHFAQAGTPALDKVVDAFAPKFTGTVVVRNHGVEYQRSVGLADDERGIANGPETRYPIASLSKSFTAAAILRAEELGKLSVGDPVSKYFPEYPIDNLRMKGIQPAVHDLLDHMAGLPEAYAFPPVAAKLYKEPVSFEEMLQAGSSHPLIFAPGEKWEYSNYGYVLLGEIVRRVSHESFWNFISAEFLSKLGLKKTTIGLPGGVETVAQPYEKISGKRRNYLKAHGIRELHLGDQFTDGSIVTTAGDFTTWVEKLSTGNVLSADSTRRMFTPYNKEEYGYAWYSYADEKGRKTYQHSGSWAGWQGTAYRYPELDLTVVVLMNQPMNSKDQQTFVEKLTAASLN